MSYFIGSLRIGVIPTEGEMFWGASDWYWLNLLSINSFWAATMGWYSIYELYFKLPFNYRNVYWGFGVLGFW